MKRFPGHLITMVPTDRQTLHTARTVYSVHCLTCGVVVHSGTNAPTLRILEHVATCVVCGETAEEGTYGFIHQCPLSEMTSENSGGEAARPTRLDTPERVRKDLQPNSADQALSGSTGKGRQVTNQSGDKP